MREGPPWKAAPRCAEQPRPKKLTLPALLALLALQGGYGRGGPGVPYGGNGGGRGMGMGMMPRERDAWIASGKPMAGPEGWTQYETADTGAPGRRRGRGDGARRMRRLAGRVAWGRGEVGRRRDRAEAEATLAGRAAWGPGWAAARRLSLEKRGTGFGARLGSQGWAGGRSRGHRAGSSLLCQLALL